jgi:hypothetical protein
LGFILQRFATTRSLSMAFTSEEQLLQDAPIVQTKTKNVSTTTSTTSTTATHPTTTIIKLVFFIGLEGTGHHLMGSILNGSPLRRRFRALGSDVHRGEIQKYLYVSKFKKNQNKTRVGSAAKQPKTNGQGLWNAHCNIEGDDAVDTRNLQILLIQELKDMVDELQTRSNTTAAAHNNRNATTTIYFPINTINTNRGFGMISYPNYDYECRFLAYPNLDIWYDDICDDMAVMAETGMVRVDCQHVYLYRDPTAILRSTTFHRDFNPTVLTAIHLYTTMLHIIAGQLDAHADRTMGCFGFYEPNGDTSSWWDDVRVLGGWKNSDNDNDNDDDYERFMTDLYKAPAPVNGSLIGTSDDHYRAYMKPLQKLHDRVVRLCRESRRRNAPL